MPSYEADKKRAAAYHLTERELEVLCLLAEGLNSKQIGVRLYISDSTVREHIANMGRKLEARGAAMVVVAALQHGIIRRSREP